MSKKDLKRNARKEKKNSAEKEPVMTEADEREQLVRGIANLKERIDNIDTIMANRKHNGEEK